MYNEIRKKCCDILALSSLTSDANITRHQVALCCRTLVDLAETGCIDVDLTACHLKVAQFYSVMSDGDICIPWNFDSLI